MDQWHGLDQETGGSRADHGESEAETRLGAEF